MSDAAEVASGQILGRREKQEDRVGIGRSLDGAHVLVLADGMGGHAGGDTAATLAVEAFLSSTKALPASVEAMRDALSDANARLRKSAASNPKLEGMGCTLLGVTIAKRELRWISVGDSPLFLLRGGELRRLNQDHSMREILDGMVQAGRLSAEDAARDPHRNALRSAVSGGEIELIDAPEATIALEAGDVVLLASDGIETLQLDEIRHVAAGAARGGARRIVDRLLSAVRVRRQKYQDNTSIVAYLYAAGSPSPRRKEIVIAAALLALVAALSATAVLMHPAAPRAGHSKVPHDAP